MNVYSREGQLVHRRRTLCLEKNMTAQQFVPSWLVWKVHMAHDQALLNEAKIDLNLSAQTKRKIAQHQLDDQQQTRLSI